MGRRQFIPTALGLAAMLLCLSASARADDKLDAKVAKIKAAYLLNFIKYTTWPDESFEDEDTPIVVGVIDRKKTLGPTIEKTIRGKSAHDRRIVVRRLLIPTAPPEPTVEQEKARRQAVEEFLEQTRRCHLLYICGCEADKVKWILEELNGSDVLTVSDTPEFAERGGMLGLTLRRKRVVFDANPRAIGKTNVKVSSKVLKLARIVKTGGDDEE